MGGQNSIEDASKAVNHCLRNYSDFTLKLDSTNLHSGKFWVAPADFIGPK